VWRASQKINFKQAMVDKKTNQLSEDFVGIAGLCNT